MVVATILAAACFSDASARAVIPVSSTTTLPLACDGDIAASGGYMQLTLPTAPIVDRCDIFLMNIDSTSGKFLIGFPSDVNPKLYPNTGVGVTSVGGQWVSKSKPGRFRIPGGTMIYVSDMGNDNNDGLSPATPLRHNYKAVLVVQSDLDTNQTTPFIALKAGSVFADDPINLGGQPTGGNLIGLTIYGGPGVATITNGDYGAINVGDNAELDYELPAGTELRLQGNYNDRFGQASGIYQHNNGLWDGNLSSTSTGVLTIIGNGPNTAAFFFDGPTPGAAADKIFQIGGQFGDVWHMDEGGGRFTLSAKFRPITFNGRPCYITRYVAVLGNGQLLLGPPDQFPSGNPAAPNYVPGTVYGNPVQPSIVAGTALIVSGGITVEGGPITQLQSGKVYSTKQ